MATVDTLTRTEDQVAAETGVSPRTVRSDNKYAVALDRIGRINSQAKSDILNGGLKLSRRDVVAIGQQDAEGIGQALCNVRNGRKWCNVDIPPAASTAPSTKQEERLAWNRDIQSFARKITSLIDDVPVGPWLDESRLEHVGNQLRSAAATVRQAKCHALTKPGCHWDRGAGYAPKHVIDQHHA